MHFSVLFDFLKYYVLFMPFSFASSMPSAVTTYIASHRVWDPISGLFVCFRWLPPPGIKYEEKIRKALFYLDFTTISGMKVPTKCSALGLSYGLSLR